MTLFTDKWQTYCRFRPLYGRDAVCIGADDDYGAFVDFINRFPAVIMKPACGSCGTGVKLLDAVACRQGPERPFAEMLAAGKNILEEPIAQSSLLASFHPASVNTVRVVTFCGRDGCRPLWAFLKTGRNGSVTDNGAGGGIMAGIDLLNGLVVTGGLDERGRRYAVHPDTGKPFAGFYLPDWASLLEMCVHAALSVPTVRMIGWDAAHTDDGWRMVEGNAQSEMIGPQAVFGCGIRQNVMELLRELRLPTDMYRV